MPEAWFSTEPSHIRSANPPSLCVAILTLGTRFQNIPSGARTTGITDREPPRVQANTAQPPNHGRLDRSGLWYCLLSASARVRGSWRDSAKGQRMARMGSVSFRPLPARFTKLSIVVREYSSAV
jgi:hypothetical protein